MIEPTELTPPQREVADRGLLESGFSCVLQLPTGAGKTWMAERAIEATLRRGRRAIYLSPLRALASELHDRWKVTFEGFRVGVFTGEFGAKLAYPVPFDQAQLLIMTPERLDACTRSWRSHWGWIPEVDLLVVDELHLLGERGRGARLEGALLRIRRLNPFMQLLALSATLGNRQELADWLGGVSYASDWRPIKLEWRTARFRRATDKPEILLAEVSRCIASGGQSLVFVQSRRRAEALSAHLREAGLAADHHHAGLDSPERRRLEASYRNRELQVLVSTGTLEMGLNLPARQVILYDLQAFDGSGFTPLPVNTVWQRAGRAGRRGQDDQGEVVLLAPSWEKNTDHYIKGRFENINSRLAEARALSEQVLAEVASGLSRTRSQLNRAFLQSLAAHQNVLPSMQTIADEMIAGGMLTETEDESSRRSTLKATRLGRIAVRQMLSPATVLMLSRALHASDAELLSLLDILLLCSSSEDCEPIIPADFEELEDLCARLSHETSHLLQGSAAEIEERLGLKGPQLLGAIKSALLLRAWTRLGSDTEAAEAFGCYAFEVRRLAESMTRILTAAYAVVTPPRDPNVETTEPPVPVALTDEPTLRERVRALLAMITHGVDEQTVTLTFLEGVGGTLARRLYDAGVRDIEDLSLCAPEELAALRGISRSRASNWIAQAGELIKVRSAFALRETGNKAIVGTGTWHTTEDPYRLRRAMELQVDPLAGHFIVSGGLEPHQVTQTNSHLRCDCADHEKGHTCKHILAVRLHQGDPELTSVLALSAAQTNSQMDLLNIWFQGRAR